MIKTDETGKGILCYEVSGAIRRIPLQKRGVSRKNIPWTLGSILLEVGEDGVNGSAPLFLVTFNEELIERFERIGVGKNVKVVFHIETREFMDRFNVSCVLDSIDLVSERENYILGK